MLNEIAKEAETRMKKSVEAVIEHFKKIRTGRAHPSILDSVQVMYYGAPVPLQHIDDFPLGKTNGFRYRKSYL